MSLKRHAPRVAPILTGTLLAGIPLMAPAAQGARPPADSRPAPATTNNWWDAPVPGADPRLPERDDFSRQLFRHDLPNQVTDFPSAMVNDWVVANTMAARARSILLRVESDLSATIRRVQQRMERSPEFSDAVQGERQAYADYTAARQRALGSVANDPKYHAISLLRDELGEKIAIRRAAKDVNGDEILAMATLKMQYASDARAIEVAALSNDDSLKAAREKMVAASHRLSELRARIEDSLREQPEVVAARRNLEEARIAVVQTATLAYSTSLAGGYALNYAYFLHRNDNGGVYGTYGTSGNYGIYGSPYWVGR